jgi:hypothetical protein
VLFDFVQEGGCTLAVMVLALELAINLWMVYVASCTLAEAHRFTSARGLATLLIAAALPLVITAAAALALRL